MKPSYPLAAFILVCAGLLSFRACCRIQDMLHPHADDSLTDWQSSSRGDTQENAGPSNYAQAKERVLRQGRDIVALLGAGKASELYARLTPAFQRQIAQDDLQRIIASVQAVFAQGRCLGENIHANSPRSQSYTAEYALDGRIQSADMIFDEAGRVAGLLLHPRRVLPADPNADYTMKTRLRLPVEGAWLVWWGGDTERENYHVIAPDQRHAYDLVVWKAGGTFRGDGARNADYWAWGRPIAAPAAGVVAEAVNDVADGAPGQPANAAAPFGNHVVLDMGSHEFAVLAHMQKGSLRVRAGDTVRAGQTLGLCGNSGNSSEPHLHFHVQNGPRLYGASGLPITIRNYNADDRRVAQGTPTQGQMISSQASPAAEAIQ